ncbi:MAG: porin family protein [Cyclobacteriaceae bacterium]
MSISYFKYLLLIFLLIYALTSYAQLQNLKIGLKGGLALSNLSPQSPAEQLPRIGFHAAGFVEWRFNNRLSLQPELMLNSGGGISYLEPDIMSVERGTINEAETRLLYFSLPMMFRFRLSKWLACEAGPYLSYLAESEVQYRGGSAVMLQNGTENYTLNRWHTGLRSGLSLELAPVRLGISYVLGLTPSLRSEEAGLLPERGKNNIWQASIGLEF